MREPHERSPKQEVVMKHGTKVRYARCLVATANNANALNEGTFTPDEIALLQEIEKDVIARSEKVKIAELSVIDDPKARRGTEAESRQYNGK